MNLLFLVIAIIIVSMILC